MMPQELKSLCEKLNQQFNREELRTLCLYLGVDYDDLPATGKTHQIWELVLLINRQERLNELIKCCDSLRPNGNWSTLQPVQVSVNYLKDQIPKKGNILKVCKIFISCPSDVQKERKILIEVIDKLNRNEARLRNIFVEIQDWQDVIPKVGQRPQKEILDQLKLEETDVLIMILWHRFGSPPGTVNPDTGQPFSSGTEEEFITAYNLFKATGHPEILVYRCQRKITIKEVDPQQLNKVDRLFKEFGPGKKYQGLYHKYDKESDFRESIELHLLKLLKKLDQR